jgi:hypothetical protein
MATDFQMRLAEAAKMQTFTIDTRELVEARRAYETAGVNVTRALTAAVNHTAQISWTTARRVLSAEMGLPQGELRPYIYIRRATFNSIEWQAVGAGKPISLRAFGATQRSSGVSARPWGKRRIFRSTFIVDSLGGSVYKRVGPKVLMTRGASKGKYRQAIEKLYGPAVPKEMMAQAVTSAFRNEAATRLPVRLDYELSRALRQIGPRPA